MISPICKSLPQYRGKSRLQSLTCVKDLVVFLVYGQHVNTFEVVDAFDKKIYLHNLEDDRTKKSLISKLPCIC